MGKVIASYLVRVTLHERDDHEGLEQWQDQPLPQPTIEELKTIVEGAIYDDLPYYSREAIGVSAERVDH